MTIRIRTGKNFQKGLSYAKRARGVYHAATQTWNIPEPCNMLNAPAMYGWEIVNPAALTRTAPCVNCGTYCDGDCSR